MMEALGLAVEPRVIRFESDGTSRKQKLRIINEGPNAREMYFDRGPILNTFTFETKFTKPSKLPAGFEISALIGYHCCTNEALVDNVVVRVDDKPYEVRLIVEPMRSKLVVKSDKLDFGKVVAAENHVLWKELVLYNEGSKEGIFHILCPTTNMISKIDPTSGTISKSGKQSIVIFLAPGMLGEFEVTLSVTMDDVIHDVRVTGVVMEHLLELRDVEGKEVLSKVKFPPTYYGEDSTFDATLVNVASETVAFAVAFLDEDGDGRRCDEDNEDGAVVCDKTSSEVESEAENPFYAGKDQLKEKNSISASCKYSGISADRKFESLNDVSSRLQSCQECCGCLNPLPTLVTVSPSEGLLKPDEVLRVRFRFSPRWLSGNKGFKCFKMCPPSREHVIDMTCLASQVGGAFKVNGQLPPQRFVKGLPLTAEGISVPAELSLLPDDFLDLGSCSVGLQRQSKLLVYNRSPWLPCRFKVRPLAHFHFSEVEGSIDPNEELEILVTFLPKQSGVFEPIMKIDMFGKRCSEENIFVETTKVFHTVKLKVTGSAQYIPGGKMKKPVVNEGLSAKKASEIGTKVEMKLSEIAEQSKRHRPSIKSFHAFKKDAVSNVDFSTSRESEVTFYVKSRDSVGEGGCEKDSKGSLGDDLNDYSSAVQSSNNNSSKLPTLKTNPSKAISNEKQSHFDPEYMFTDGELEAVQRHKEHYNKYIGGLGGSRRGTAKRPSAVTAGNRGAPGSVEGVDSKRNEKSNNNSNKSNNKESKSTRMNSIDLEYDNINYALTFLDSRTPSGTSANPYLPNRFSRIMTITSSQYLKKVSSKFYEPTTALQKTDCSKKLSRTQLNFVTIEPGVLDFEVVCAEHPVEGTLNVSNNLDRYILVEFETLTPELADSRNVRQVVPPKAIVEVNIVLKPQELGKYFYALPYKINGEPIGYIIVTAFSCLAALELSSVTLELKQKNSLPTDKFIRGYVTISNPLNNKAYFNWGISGLVQDLPVEEPSVFVTPMKGSITPYGVLQCEVCCNPVALKSFHFNLMLDVRTGSPSILSCYVELEKPKVSFLTPKIILKDATLKEHVVLHALLKNNGMRPAYYRIQDPEPLMELKVGPPVGMVPPGGVEMISIQYLPKKLVWFDVSIFIDLKAGKDLELRIISNVEIPNVVLDVTHFKFGQVFCNTTSAIPFVLTNKGNAKAIVGFNLKGKHDFKIKSDGDMERKTMFVKAAGFHMIKLAGKEQIHGTLEYSPTQISSTNFILTLSLENLLTGKPLRGRSFMKHMRRNTSTFQISRRVDLGSFQDSIFPSFRIQTARKSLVLQNFVMEPLRIPVDAVVVREPLVVDVNEIHFEVRTESLSNTAEQRKELIITNNNKERSSAFCLDLHQPDFHNGVFQVEIQKQESIDPISNFGEPEPPGGDREAPDKTEGKYDEPSRTARVAAYQISDDVVYGNFKVTGMLGVGQQARLTIVFTPDCRGNRTSFQADMTLVYNNKRYLVIPVTGRVRIPFVTFSPPKVIFQPIPLNTKSTVRLTIVAHNYPTDTTLHVSPFEAKNQSGRVINPITLRFTNSRRAREVRLTVENKKNLTATIILQSEEPVCFSGFIHFMDGFGNKFQLSVTGSCDNCLLSTCFFMVQNQLVYRFLMKSLKLKDEDLESFPELEETESGSKRETLQSCSFLAASILPFSRSVDQGSLKPSLKKSKFGESTFSLRRDALGRRTLHTTFSLPAENLEVLKRASTITASSIITVDTSKLNFGSFSRIEPAVNNRKDVDEKLVSNNNNDNKDAVINNDNSNDNNCVDDGKSKKGKKKIVVRMYDIICDEDEEEEEEELIGYLDRKPCRAFDRPLASDDCDEDFDDILFTFDDYVPGTDDGNNCSHSNENDFNKTDDNNHSKKSSNRNYNDNRSNEDNTITSSLDNVETAFNRECLRTQAIHLKLDNGSPLQLRNFGTYFVPDLNVGERLHFEHILMAVEKWISLHGWTDAVRCAKLPNFLRKWSYSKEQSRVSPQNSVSHLEKNFFRELFICLTGGEWDVKFVKVVPKDPLERALAHHRQFSDVVEYISQNGGCVPHLKPEYFLDADDYVTWSRKTKTFMSGTYEGSILKSQELILYEAMSLRAWLDVILQLIKITLFRRITIKRFKEQPMPCEPLQFLGKTGPELQDQPGQQTGREWPDVDGDPLASNMYSLQERILLTWMEFVYNEFVASLWSNFIVSRTPEKRELSNFDQDLSDGVIIITILFAHAPHLIDRELSNVYLEPETSEEKLHNAICIVRATRIINLDFHIEAQDIFNPNPLSLLLFTAHLFFHLPSYIPKQRLSILFQLNRPVFRQIELNNPSSETLVYEAFLLGSESGNFSIEGEPNMKISRLSEDAVSSIMQLSSSDLLKPEMKVNRRIYRGLSKLYDEGSLYSRRMTEALFRKVSWLEMAESKRTLSKPLREKVMTSTMKFYHPDLVLSTRTNLNYSALPGSSNLNNSNEGQAYSLRNQKNLVMTTSMRETGELLKTFEIPPNGKVLLYLCFKSNKLNSCYGCLFMVARKVSKYSGIRSVGLGANIVFNLEAHLRALHLQQEELIKVEGPCYEEQELKIPIYNDSNKNMKLKVFLYAGSQYYGHRKKAFTLSQRAVSMAFFSTTKKLIVKKGAQAELTLVFLPLAEKVHFCTVILREEEQGDLCYMVCGVAKPPLIEKFENSKDIGGRVKMRTTKTDVHWTCRVKQTIERVVYIPVVNTAREEAVKKVQRYLRTHTNDYEFDERLTKLNFNRVVYGSSEANPMNAFMDVMYSVELTSSNFSTRNLVRFPNSRVMLEKILDYHKVFPAAFPLTFRFSADLSGIYHSKIYLKNLANLNDYRIFEVLCTVLPLDDVPTIKMVAPVGSYISQDIPIINETTAEWNLEANISGNLSFAGPKYLYVPPKITLMFKIRFTPMFEKITEAELILTDRRNNVRLKFNLVGEGMIASPSEKVVLDGVVGESFKKQFKVFNPALQRLEFFVQSDLDIFCGDESFIVMPKSYHLYEATITPSRRGCQTGVLTFVASDKRLWDPDSPRSDEDVTVKNFSKEGRENHGHCKVWYEVEINALPAPSLATIEINCVCLTTTEIEVSIDNPLPRVLNFEVGLSSPDLRGASTMEVGAEQTSLYKAEYSPGAICSGREENISFYHPKTGEFWYKLVITATAIPSTKISEVSCELGNFCVGQIPLRNPSAHVVKLTPFTTEEHSFSWNLDGSLELPARSLMLVDYTFTPRRLNSHNVRIGFQSEQIGMWEFEITGMGVVPKLQETIEIVCSPNSQAWHILPFTNTTDFPMMVNLGLIDGSKDCNPSEEVKVPIFTILNKNKRLKLQPGRRIEIIILFTPSSLRLHKGWICTVEGIRTDGSHWDEEGHHPSLEWKFPLLGRAQMSRPEPKFFFCGGLDLEVAACFKTFVNERICRELELVLECVPKEDAIAKDNFDHSLVAHPTAAGDLRRFVRVELSEVSGEGSSSRLKFDVQFNPSRTIRQLGDLVVTNRRGNCWRYRLLFEAEENIPCRELHMWAEGLNQESSTNFLLQCPECYGDTFTAKLSEGSAREFSVSPTEGIISRDGVVFTVLFKPVAYGKIFKAKIIVQTRRCKWLYVVHGHYPTYDPPKNSPASNFYVVPATKKKPYTNFIRENMKINVTAASSPCKRNCT